MASKRGFNKALKCTIVKIDTECLNQVKLYCKDGSILVIDAEVELNLPVIWMSKLAAPKKKVKKTTKKKVKK